MVTSRAAAAGMIASVPFADTGGTSIMVDDEVMFTFRKTGQIWTLTYSVSSSRRVWMLAAALAALVVGMIEEANASRPHGALALIGAIVVSLGFVAYWQFRDASTTAVFDLESRTLKVHASRPFFGPPRVIPFADIAELKVEAEYSESTDSWLAVLSLSSGSRIRLGNSKVETAAFVNGSARSERPQTYRSSLTSVKRHP